MSDDRAFPRRIVVAGAGALGVAATLAACSSYGDDDGSDSATTTASTGAAATSAAATPAGTALGSASDVPVGGGAIYAGQKVVVTQPTSGTYRGFSAVCTHQGCTVSSVTDGEIVCNCHNSHFSATDGSVVSGPAKKALASESVTVSGGTVYLT